MPWNVNRVDRSLETLPNKKKKYVNRLIACKPVPNRKSEQIQSVPTHLCQHFSHLLKPRSLNVARTAHIYLVNIFSFAPKKECRNEIPRTSSVSKLHSSNCSLFIAEVVLKFVSKNLIIYAHPPSEVPGSPLEAKNA